jgi:hypothetical protein
MRNKKEAKNEYVTHKELENLLGEQTKVIVGAVDKILDNRLGKLETKLEKKIEDVKRELKKDIGGVQKLIDSYVKEQEGFKQEFVIMKEEMRIMKDIIKNKLGIEVKVF